MPTPFERQCFKFFSLTLSISSYISLKGTVKNLSARNATKVNAVNLAYFLSGTKIIVYYLAEN